MTLDEARAEQLRQGVEKVMSPKNEGFIIVSFSGDDMTFDHSINLFQICHAKLRLEQIYQHMLFHMKQPQAKPEPTPHPGTKSQQ